MQTQKKKKQKQIDENDEDVDTQMVRLIYQYPRVVYDVLQHSKPILASIKARICVINEVKKRVWGIFNKNNACHYLEFLDYIQLRKTCKQMYDFVHTASIDAMGIGVSSVDYVHKILGSAKSRLPAHILFRYFQQVPKSQQQENIIHWAKIANKQSCNEECIVDLWSVHLCLPKLPEHIRILSILKILPSTNVCTLLPPDHISNIVYLSLPRYHRERLPNPMLNLPKVEFFRYVGWLDFPINALYLKKLSVRASSFDIPHTNLSLIAYQVRCESMQFILYCDFFDAMLPIPTMSNKTVKKLAIKGGKITFNVVQRFLNHFPEVKDIHISETDGQFYLNFDECKKLFQFRIITFTYEHPTSEYCLRPCDSVPWPSWDWDSWKVY